MRRWLVQFLVLWAVFVVAICGGSAIEGELTTGAAVRTVLFTPIGVLLAQAIWWVKDAAGTPPELPPRMRDGADAD